MGDCGVVMSRSCASRTRIPREIRGGMRSALRGLMRTFLRLAFIATTISAAACSHTTHDAATAHDQSSARGDALVVRAASCWLGGIWSDALGEKKLAWSDTRTSG